MPVGGDVIELTHEQSYLSQQINNVYYFEAVDGTATLTGLATWFETNIVPLVKAMQNDLCSHTNLRLRNLFTLSETYEEPLTGTGGYASGVLEAPAFLAMTVRFDHTNGSVRPGFKRVGGVGMGQVNDATWVAGMITAMTNYGTALVNPLTPALATWAHVIINRVCDELNPVMGAVPRCLKYRLPNAQIESDPGYPVTYEPYSQPTTQNSRKWYT